jgi:hypothetical protein
MRRQKYFIYSFTAMVLLVAIGTGCKKFLDVNKNVNSPTAVPVSLLLSNAERNIASVTWPWEPALVTPWVYMYTSLPAV